LEKLNVGNIIEDLRKFAKDRDWDQFHTPKNLSMALSVEASELLEQFQWLTEEESIKLKDPSHNPDKRTAISEEIADVLLYAFRMADVLNIDLAAVTKDKLKKNGDKYPVEKAKGLATKYNQLK
jgi:dCTP diphosphatase